ncbi:Bifunctional epoxide hydrolase 2 [Mortierella sp. GBA43]|nr:Bifunctional epoxide hydrolase 2 [Mortierella sp. GBA43]
MTCGIRYHYVEEGDPKGEPLLLVHGFPDLWYGWRHQIKFLANLGYRVLVVDCVGYGETGAPMELHKYGLKSVCTHLVGILDILNIPKVTLIGHDWGGAVVWRFGLHFPNRVHGIISICTPYAPPSPKYRSLEDIVKSIPEFEYQLGFADPSTAAKLDNIPEKFLGTILETGGDVHEKDMDYMVQQYKISGFRGPLNYYKTTRVNYDDDRDAQGKVIINLPCWLISATNDPYLRPERSVKMKDYLPQLKTTSITAGHFVMTEKPDEINELLKQSLEDLALRRNRASL